jgi:hypothetical protein
VFAIIDLGDCLSAEVNMEKRILFFFHNTIQLPFIVKKIPESLYFGVS